MRKYKERARTFREPTKPYPIRLPDEVIDLLREIASRNRRTLGGQVAAWVDAERRVTAAQGDSRHDKAD